MIFPDHATQGSRLMAVAEEDRQRRNADGIRPARMQLYAWGDREPPSNGTTTAR